MRGHSVTDQDKTSMFEALSESYCYTVIQFRIWESKLLLTQRAAQNFGNIE
jgi:hypothetical protein